MLMSLLRNRRSLEITLSVPFNYSAMMVVPDLFGPGMAEDVHTFYSILIHPVIKKHPHLNTFHPIKKNLF